MIWMEMIEKSTMIAPSWGKGRDERTAQEDADTEETASGCPVKGYGAHGAQR